MRTRRHIEVAVAVFLLLLLVVRADSFKLPTMSEEHEDLKDWVETVRASDIQNARNPKDPAARKASEGVHPMYADNLTDMEETLPLNWRARPFDWWDFPDWWMDPYGEYGTRPGRFPWDPRPPGGDAWRICRPEAGGYYIECGTCETWQINQPAEDIIEVTTFSGQGALMSVSNDAIELCAYAGAESGQEIVVGYTQTPVIGGKKYPETYCEKTYYIQCDDCECIGAEPPIYADSTTIDRPGGANPTVDLWVGSSLACGPFTWTVTGTGFYFGGAAFPPTTGYTEEELEIITLYTDAMACGTATITVTDKCGVTSTGYVRCVAPHGEWANATGGCILSGDYDETHNIWAGFDAYRKTQGKYRQSQEVARCVSHGSQTCDTYEATCSSLCDGSDPRYCDECNPTWGCTPCLNLPHGFPCHDNGSPPASCYCNASFVGNVGLYYEEWVCP